MEYIKFKIEDLVESHNIAELCLKKDGGREFLDKIGQDVVDEYLQDKQSRSKWEKNQAEAMKLALQVVEKKSFPWANASNVKFPLVTIAAMQFHSRAYPALIDSPTVAKCYVAGQDKDGIEQARAERISSHMNYQIFVEDETWEEQMDRALLALPIAGSIFKKTFFDSVHGINKSILVLPNNFVCDYYTTDLNTSNRFTHTLVWNKNKLIEKIRSGVFLKVELTEPAPIEKNQIEQAKDDSQGLNDSSKSGMYSILEQYTWLDLDGDDYKEPYIVTVREDTKEVLRIVARYFDQGDVHRTNDGAIKRFEDLRSKQENQNQIEQIEKEIERLRTDKDNKIVRIDPIQTFTKYGFIPSPDGGFYDIGYGTLLGPLNASVDTLINQLIDSGTMSNTAGGFLGRGVRLKKGSTTFDPFEWKPIDSTGDDIRKNIYPLPVREPSQVLFTLLSLLVNYAERISGSVDIMVGQNPGQNTPAETSRTMVEQGMKIFSGIYKRVHRSMTNELKAWYRLNQLYLEDQVHFLALTTGQGAMVSRDDYTRSNIFVVPEADPNIASDSQKISQALMLAQRASSVPGYNLYEVEKVIAKAHKIKGFDKLYPDPKGPNAIKPPVPLKIQQEQLKQQSSQLDAQIKLKLGILNLMQEAQVNQAKIQKLEAEAIKTLAEAKGVDTGHQIALLEAQIGATKAHNESILRTVELMQKAIEGEREHELNNSRVNGMGQGRSDTGASGEA